MKSYIKLLSLGAVLAGAAGCTDLDTPLKTRYESLPDNPIAYESEFNSCYRNMHGYFGRDFCEGVVTQGDELMGVCYGLGNYYDDGRKINGSIHSLTLENWNCRFIMDLMSACGNINKTILKYGGPDQKAPEVAPLRVMRAYYTFWMMELWGDAPILDRVVLEGEFVDRAPRADVAKWIEGELLEVLAQEDALSKNNNLSTYGKPNYWMAAALLAKVYLNWGVYTHDITTVDNNTPNEKLADCVKWCDEIIRSGVFEVGKGYRKKFFPDNGVQIKDFIYALDVDPSGSKVVGTETWYRWFACKKDANCEPAGLMGWIPSESVAGAYVLTKESVDRFNLPGDERNEVILQGPQYAFDSNFNRTTTPVILNEVPGDPSMVIGQLNFHVDFEFDDASIYSLGSESQPTPTDATVADGTAWLNIQKGARCMKFPPREEDFKLWKRQQANDYPIFRYADILLMKAECILRGAAATNGETVESLVNQVRACSGAPSVTGSFTLQDLMDERSREFILEPWRRNDLIRCGMFENDWGQKNRYKVWDNDEHTSFHWVEREGAKDPNRRLMPIHREVLERNTNWSQNPGYRGL